MSDSYATRTKRKSNKKNSRTVRNNGKLKIQRKLKVGRSNSASERSADQVAHRVMSLPDRIGQGKKSHGNYLAWYGNTYSPEGEMLQTKSDAGGGYAVDSRTESGIRQMQNAGGEKIPQGERNFFEPRLGRDLSKVRIHRSREAAELAAGVNARAFVVRMTCMPA